MFYCATSWGRALYIGENNVELFESCSTSHKINIAFDNEYWCVPLTSEWQDNSLHVAFNGVTYTVCGSSCNEQSEDEVPEIPPEPIVIEDEDCQYSQTITNAYLLSDGNQFFDTGVSVDTSINISVTVQVINGHSARIFGTTNPESTCFYDFTINASRHAFFKIGTLTSSTQIDFTEAQSKQKITFYTTTNTSTSKWIYRVLSSGTSNRFSKNMGSACTSSDTLKVLNNLLVSSVDQTQSGGIKLYSIVLTDSSGNTIHNYQPVAKGTNICGYITPQNGMWDTVTKQFYLAGGSGVMGYGVDE